MENGTLYQEINILENENIISVDLTANRLIEILGTGKILNVHLKTWVKYGDRLAIESEFFGTANIIKGERYGLGIIQIIAFPYVCNIGIESPESPPYCITGKIDINST